MSGTREWSWALVVAVSLAACGDRDAERIFPPLEEPDAGTFSDAADDAGHDAGDDAGDDASPDGSDSLACETAADCPAPSQPCTLAVCAAGVCATAYAPAGTEVAEEVQTPGDCKRLECGEAGALVARADEDDVPPEQDCVRSFCVGPNARTEDLPAGTPCGGNGVCNGAGHCGSCAPGAKGCSGNVPYSCDEQGKWRAGQACSSACKAGECED